VELKRWEYDSKVWIHGTPPTRPKNFADRLRWCEQNIGVRNELWTTSVSGGGIQWWFARADDLVLFQLIWD
jgi:hypothetical protein